MAACSCCGTANPVNANFCCQCGSSIQTRITNTTAGEEESNVVGKICPYCQTPIKPGTDIVLCKECGMPHHLACWIENGHHCTTFGCMGSDANLKNNTEKQDYLESKNNASTVNHAMEDNDNVVTCPYCSTRNSLRSDQIGSLANCGMCHKPLPRQQQSTPGYHSSAGNNNVKWIAAIIVIFIFLVGGAVYASQNGNGTIVLQDGSTYTGSYKNKIPDGYGTLSRKDGIKYTGNFRKGKFQGSGTLSLPNGSEYKGNFENGSFSGQGILTKADGTKYTGQFANDKYNGEGTLETSANLKIQGFFKDGKPEGKAKMSIPNGAYMTCEFHNGVPNGLAVAIRPNENYIYEQNFVNGELVGQEAKKAPFTIRNIVLSNTAKDNTTLSTGSQFSQQSIRYISYSLEIVSAFPRSFSGSLEVIYRGPSGYVYRNTSTSPPGISEAKPISLSPNGSSQIINSGWGNAKAGTYSKGRHKIEFWWGDVKVEEVSFDVI